MLIHRIAAQLYTAEALQTVEAGLDAGEDVTLAVSQSGRTLMAVGLAHVCRFPERKDYPWREQAPDDAVVAQRCEALGRIVRGDNCIMVASARALLRCVPPVESRYWESTTFAVGEEIPFDEVPQRLVGMGYTNAGAADAPGLFRVHGDTVEVFPAQEKAPVRIEFYRRGRPQHACGALSRQPGRQQAGRIARDGGCAHRYTRARPLFAGNVRPDREPAGARERQGARGAVRAALAVRRLPACLRGYRGACWRGRD